MGCVPEDQTFERRSPTPIGQGARPEEGYPLAAQLAYLFEAELYLWAQQLQDPIILTKSEYIGARFVTDADQ